MRIAVGGFQHETNTFAAHPASLADFEAPDAWPGLVRGADLFEAVSGINLPAAGFIDAMRTRHELTPLVWCSATPSGRVTREAYEHISRLLLDDLERNRGVDAVYLDLHGAMVAEHIDDADGELLRRVRTLVGQDVRIVASLDYHANVSDLMVRSADALIAYRSYPHIDMSEAGARAGRCLLEVGKRPFVSERMDVPFLIPLTSQCTLVEPMTTLMDELSQLERTPIHTLSFTPGFPAADVEECGPSVFGYGTDRAVLRGAVERLASRVRAFEPDFAPQIHSIEATLRLLARTSHVAGRPIVLADTQDNPGGGGTADTTSLLKALHEHAVPRVLAGILCDPLAAARAHEAGVGARIDIALGGRSGYGETPFVGRFEVVTVGDGRFTATGPFYRGARMDLGATALLRIGELHIAVSSRKQQAADRAMFRHLRVEPAQFGVLALKSSVHFRADFGPIASQIVVVAAPGANTADPSQLAFTKMKRRVARAPS